MVGSLQWKRRVSNRHRPTRCLIEPAAFSYPTKDWDLNSEQQDALRVVCAFCSAMNVWETRMHYRSRIEAGQFVPAAQAEALAGTTYQGVMDEYYVPFGRYCTQRERRYGGAPNAWSKGGAYAGVDERAVTAVETVKPGRIEVVVSGGLFPGQAFRFVLLASRDEWRIDSASTRQAAEDPWERHHL